MAKEKISITVDIDIVKKVKDKINEGVFRNKSHAFEYAVKKLLAKQES